MEFKDSGNLKKLIAKSKLIEIKGVFSLGNVALNFAYGYIINKKFTNCIIKNGDFTCTIFTECEFKNVEFKNCNLDFASFTNCQFDDCRLKNGTQDLIFFTNCNIKKKLLITDDTNMIEMSSEEVDKFFKRRA